MFAYSTISAYRSSFRAANRLSDLYFLGVSSMKTCLYLVPVTGLEPVRILLRGILSPLRLPIPPYGHIFLSVQNVKRLSALSEKYYRRCSKIIRNTAVTGFEPMLSESKSNVLPLHHTASKNCHSYYDLYFVLLYIFLYLFTDYISYYTTTQNICQ